MSYKKIGNQYQNSGPLQSQVITGRTWHKILVKYTIQMSDRSGTNMAQISVTSHICLQDIPHAQLGNYSPYELVFRRRPKILINIETDPDIKVSGTYKDYHTLLTKRLDYLQNMLQNFKMK